MHDLLVSLTRAKGWSTHELARRARVTSSTVQRWINGDTVPQAATALAVAALFHPEQGADLLKSWGYPEAAEALLDPSEDVTYDAGTADGWRLDSIRDELRRTNKLLARIDGNLRLLATRREDA